MKSLILLLLATGANAGVLDSAIADLRGNTGFKVESALPYVARSWERGDWAAGSAFPFFKIGSHVYLAGALSKDVRTADGKGELLTGCRLNDVTRPIIQEVLNRLTLGKLDKVPFLGYLSKATSVGLTVGHDFSYAEKSKVLINSYGYFLGFEVVFGNPGDVKASSDKGPVYLR